VQNFNFKVSWLAQSIVPAKVETLSKVKLSPVFFVPSCALLAEKKFFQQLGGFDRAYFLYYEDVDFCWRARLNGAEVVLCPWSVAYHYGSASKASLFLRKLYDQNFNLEAEEAFYQWRNRLRLILKNASLELAFFASLAIGFKLLLKFFLAAVTWQLELAKQYARALFWNLKTVPNLLQERRKIQAQRVLPDKVVLEQTMIFQLQNHKQKIS
jgi:GT2 family glycosyltransferase